MQFNKFLYIIERKTEATVVILLFFLVIISGVGCKKLVEVSSPNTSVTGVSAYSTDATAAAVLTGIYTNMSNSGITGELGANSLIQGLSADELTLYSGADNATYTAYYTNALNNSNTGIQDFWSNIYPIIYVANSAIEGLNASNSLTPSVKQQLLGEATFIRAFCYFYLVNLYGDVPLVTGIDYKVNTLLPRTPKAQVWQQIITDLKNAQRLLSSNYLDATLLNVTTERVRPTKAAATALLARAYLYLGDLNNDANDYVYAEEQASSVISNSSLYSLNALNNVFLKNSSEAIWQLQPVILGQNTPDAWLFIIPSTGPNTFQNPVYLSPNLLNSFEMGDQRKINWVDTITVSGILYYFPYKYKVATLNAPVTEYEMVLRLGEQYLIRAEAEAHGAGGGFAAAISDLNVIRKRAGLPKTQASTQSALLTAILNERQVELFTEWGHRWFDLKRTGNVNTVMGSVTPQKGGIWSADRQWYPIPTSELQNDPNLVQNSGY